MGARRAQVCGSDRVRERGGAQFCLTTRGLCSFGREHAGVLIAATLVRTTDRDLIVAG